MNPSQTPRGSRPGISNQILFYGVVSGIFAITSVIIFPVFQRTKSASTSREALSNMRQLGSALTLYMADNNDLLPVADTWMDGTNAYTKNMNLYRSPIFGMSDNGAFGIAFRRGMGSMNPSRIQEPAQTAMIFDSMNLKWNASGELNLLPDPPRHTREGGDVNVIEFADGHAGYVPAEGIVVK